MIQADLYNQEGQGTGKMELKENIFAQKINSDLLSFSVQTLLANRRQGTVKKKSRSECRGGGSRPWRQKGTGRARVGTIRSPIWVGGGRAFPPYPRDFSVKMTKKAKRIALLSGFSVKAKEKKIKIIEDISLEEPKTKTIYHLLKNLGLENTKCLFLFENKSEALSKSCRNIEKLFCKPAELVNTYDLFNCEYLIMTEGALRKIEEVFSR
jgi:large subunit ribosomal protein L4